jgi:DNA-binding beta-propeller fold protein YncE
VNVAAFLPSDRFVGIAVADALDASSCDALIRELECRGFERTGAAYPRGYRDNDRLVFDDATRAARLFERVAATLPRELVFEDARWRLAGLNSRFRACRYRDGQAFCIHRDGPHIPDDDTRSLLTLQIYLDDGDHMAGGRTRFYADRDGRDHWAAITPVRGTAIVFDHRVWHDGEAVTAGTKHVIRTDVMYRRSCASSADPETRVIGRHRGYAWRAIVCRDGSIASAGRDGIVRRWRGRRAIAAHDLGAGSVTALVETADRRLWCGTRNGRVVVIDGDIASVVHAGAGAILAAIDHAGRVVVATSHGTVIEIAETTAHVTRAHDGWAWALATRDGIVSAGDDGRVLEADHRIADLGRPIRALAVLPDGAILAGASDGTIHRLDLRPTSWTAHAGAITCLAVSPTGEWAASSEDGRVTRWRDDQLIRRTQARGDFVTSVAFDKAGALIATGYDGVVWTDGASS